MGKGKISLDFFLFMNQTKNQDTHWNGSVFVREVIFRNVWSMLILRCQFCMLHEDTYLEIDELVECLQLADYWFGITFLLTGYWLSVCDSK